ncbi:hypothetical protein CTAYLR_007434 [Chrysophaeum taylorii]|uniref:Glycosyltransferase n=1 Tax=Chrysophaeum taylorii TaxID=2483200 RepID=A0AAD7UBJ2_9STRA|nr:hypothetical protein CTAYLR_007434 [Chrysophaeum taylorii]
MTDDTAAVLVVVMKVPTLNKSKTRLVPAYGPEGALELARAMVKDTLRRFAFEVPSTWRRIVYFAPTDAEPELCRLLAEVEAEDAWERLPMRAHSGDLRSSDLGSVLRAGYEVVRDDRRSTLFIGMDTPDLPLDAVLAAARVARDDAAAVVLDATDGGYVLAALPAHCPSDVFFHVEWSTDHTADSQRARIRECGVPVSPAGFEPWEDVDDQTDVRSLAARLAASPGLCPALEKTISRLEGRADLTL